MRYPALVAALVLAVVVLAPQVLANGTVHVTWTNPNTGDEYYLSTGSTAGVCVVDETFASCSSANGAAYVGTAGCGETTDPGSCIVMNTPNDPTPQATTTVKCANGTVYEVSDGGSGSCTSDSSGGGHVSCTQQGTSNYSSADCNTGCGSVGGSGSCLIK